MKIELVHGRHLLVQHFLKPEQIKRGQVWASADGSNRTVWIDAVRDGWVCYVQEDGTYNEKDAFSFQCRKCLVLPSATIPETYK